MGGFSSVIKWHFTHKKLPMSPLLTLKFLLFLLWVSADAAVSADSDKSVLLQFKRSVSDPSGLLSGWNEKQPSACSWPFVSCDSNSRVASLSITGDRYVNRGNTKFNGNFFSCYNYAQFPLYGFGVKRDCIAENGKLVGKLPALIAHLTELKNLSLPFNEFDGVIPDEIWRMKHLEVLDLEGNSLSGLLPVHMIGLKKLRVLNLGFNQIIGEIPGSFSALDSLEILNLAGNQINGSVPRFAGQLREVYLSYNLLSGVVPPEIGERCGKLEHLDFSGNFLTGGIPRSLGNCSALKSLVLYSNMLEEIIPAEIGRLRKLEVLDLSRNSLSGLVPAELGNCSELSVLVLSNLFNPFPNAAVRKKDASAEQLDSMIDDFNYFEGGLPGEITVLPKLRILWAPRAALRNILPSNWGSCDNLEMVNLAQSYFTGEIPKGLTSCKRLHFLDLSSNRLGGTVVASLPVPCMTVFDVSGNMLSGPIPGFRNSRCPPLSYLNDRASNVAPQGLSSIYLLFFVNGALNGTTLQLLGGEDKIAILHNFASNNFTGSLQSMPISPERLGKQTAYAILAGGNKFSGPFLRNLFEKCNGLDAVIVNVSRNRISGPIPDEIGTMCQSLVFLDVSENQISGSLPPTFGELISLVALNLSRNLLQGQIPTTFGQMKHMKYLSLASNNLTGSIPSTFGQLHSLKVLELSSNSLSGEIPNDLVNMMNLTVLLLNNNKLSGQVPPGFANLTTLSTFNVSFNNLSGPLPPNNNLMKCNSFLGNPRLHTCPMVTLTVPSSDVQGGVGDTRDYASSPSGVPVQRNRNTGFNSIEIASIASASAIVSVLIALIILFIYTRKWKPKSRIGSTQKEVTIFTDIGIPLTFENVVVSTGGFNASNCIGNGGFGSTYKAEISPGVVVAIKRLAVGRFQGVQQFHAEIKTLGRLRHPNLVTLIGYHASEREMFLIYNYLPGGNLEKFIQERSTRAVDWRILHKIAFDIARALAYLHDTCVPRVLHRDVKPSNILLDDDYNAYLSDFGLARLLGTSETHATTGVAGTFGYVAPEYAMTCRVSDKADVYSYGVVLLELLSDKKALDPSFSSYGNGFNIVQWACMLLRQGRAEEFFTAGLWDAGPHDDLVEVLHLAVVCTVDSLSTRPSMKQVVRRLKQLQPPSC